MIVNNGMIVSWLRQADATERINKYKKGYQMPIKILKAVIVAGSLLSTSVLAKSPTNGFEFWYSEHSNPAAYGTDISEPASRIVDIEGLSDEEVVSLTGYNLSMLYKHKDPKSEENFLARQNIKALATHYDSPISSYVYAIFIELDAKNYCKTNFDCDRNLSDEMVEHFTKAAKADPTGQAAFEFAAAWGRTYIRDNKEKQLYWSTHGKKLKIEYDKAQNSSSWW